jgi:hypothetical protein
MRYDDPHYRDDHDYLLTRPGLRPDQIAQVATALASDLTNEINLGTLTGAVNNQFLPRGTSFRVTPNAALTFTGFAGGVGARFVFLLNAGSSTMTLANLNGGSAAQNQIITGAGANVTIQPDRSALLIYDSVSQKWRLVAFT